MTTSRRLAPLPLLLAGLAICAALLLIPGDSWIAHAQTNNAATGRPVILASVDEAGILYAETLGLRDADGLPYSGDTADGSSVFDQYTYRWIRVDGSSETNIGADSRRYTLVDADIGKLIKVEVSFTDDENHAESRTSRPFGPVTEPDRLPSPTTLVGNRTQTHSATANITKQYAQEFMLGNHGQGYELSGVSVELAAAPSSLTVSLWIGGHSAHRSTAPHAKVFDFENPASFQAGVNEFTTPAGAFVYQNMRYFIVLSGFGSTLSIKETNSDAQAGVDLAATIGDNALVRALNATGKWSEQRDDDEINVIVAAPTTRANVLRMSVEGSTRDSGILFSNYAQPSEGDQEIISVGDKCCFSMTVGAAHRYLIRGFSWNSDDTRGDGGGGFENPWELHEGTASNLKDGAATRRLAMFSTRSSAGSAAFTAPQGATVEGGKTYTFLMDLDLDDVVDDLERINSVLSRANAPAAGGADEPGLPGLALSAYGDASFPVGGPYATIIGESLYAMVQNLGQTDDPYLLVGPAALPVVSQGFTTGPERTGYKFLGIGVNIEGSNDSNGNAQVPDGMTSVSVSVHADSGGKPGAKLFDLVSPTEYEAGHSFFEAPRGTRLEPNTSYVVVWTHNGGTHHRLQRTSSNGEDSGAVAGFSIADAFYHGINLSNLSVSAAGHSLEIAVYGDSPSNATGRPVILPTAEDPGVLAVDTSRIGDPEGIPNVGKPDSTGVLHDFSYRWIRVDGDSETVVGAGSVDYRQIFVGFEAAGIRIESGRYRRVEADVGKLLKVEVSFTDAVGTRETVTSLPFGPVPRPERPLPASKLVGNTGQSPSTTANITGKRYNMGFKLGSHGQGYEISGVLIDLAAVPSDLTVSLWMGRAPGSGNEGTVRTKLFEFENPSTFKVGLNRFTAPAGAFAYQGNVPYFIVLSGFGGSLSIKVTTSNDEDDGGETGATLANFVGGNTSVLRLAVEGSQRARGILAATYAQPLVDDKGTVDTSDDEGPHQEIVSLGDKGGFGITVGSADRYLIRGVSFPGDNSALGGMFTTPWLLRDGTDELFRMISTRQISGINEWTAPQGATVEGGCATVMSVETCEKYNIYWEPPDPREGGVVLARMFGAASTAEDEPKADGVTIDGDTGDIELDAPLMAIFGEPLVAMVQNLGQTNNGYVSVGDPSFQVLSQGFTTGSDSFGYRLQGIGINIEGSDNVNGDAQLPGGPTFVSVAVHRADSDGKPGGKVFDLVSPTEFAPGHSFFEAPLEAQLLPDSSYVLVWSHKRGHWHRLVRTTGNGEDSGARSGAGIANAYYRGVNVGSLSVDSGGNAVEIAVYTEVNTERPRPPFVEGGIEVPSSWRHIPDGFDVGDQFRLLFVTHHATLPTSTDIDVYNKLVQDEADGYVERYDRKIGNRDPILDEHNEEFKAVVCTADDDARTNTGMPATEIGVPVHWLDGGWEDRPTLVAYSNDGFYGSTWENTEYGAYVTGNSAYFHPAAMVWTGCDASGGAHPQFFMGNTEAMDMVAVGTPNGRSLKTREEAANPNFGPVGAVDVTEGIAYHQYMVEINGKKQERLLPLYGISPVFTVVAGTEGE